MSSLYNQLQLSLESEKSVALSTIILGEAVGQKMLVWPDGRTSGNLSTKGLTEAIVRHSQRLFEQQKSERISLNVEGRTVEVFIDVFPPPPKLIIVGAVHAAISLVTFANVLGFHTKLIDPRSVFATPKRFSEVDELIVKWPHEALSASDFNESTYFVVLSHDEKLDIPALKLALENNCRYVGALGSRKTQARRTEKLKEMGITKEQLAKIHAPIGLNLGGRRAEEIAVSIIAEIVAVRNRAQIKIGE